MLSSVLKSELSELNEYEKKPSRTYSFEEFFNDTSFEDYEPMSFEYSFFGNHDEERRIIFQIPIGRVSRQYTEEILRREIQNYQIDLAFLNEANVVPNRRPTQGIELPYQFYLDRYYPIEREAIWSKIKKFIKNIWKK